MYQTFDFLNSDKICDLKLAKFKHRLKHQTSSGVFTESFTKIDSVRVHNTKQKQSIDIFLPRVKKKLSSQKKVFRGAKIKAVIHHDMKILNLIAFKKIKQSLMNNPPKDLKPYNEY